MSVLPPGRAWVNWVGNQVAVPASCARPGSEDELCELVAQAAAAGLGVRVAASGHSFTPVCVTDGLLVDLSALRGVISTDTRRRRVVAHAATPIAEFGDVLWDAGLALRNQGDIDTQQIAGAVATATHGSGLRETSFSATTRHVRLVTAAGGVVEIAEDDPVRLRAAQVAIGMLGVMTRLELDVTAAYRLRETIEHWPLARVLEEWDQRVRDHRHFSCFWLPSETSASLYGLETPPGVTVTDTAYVKIYDEAGGDEPDCHEPGRRVDRCYRIYPSVFAPNFHELEYMVPISRAHDAIRAMRELMLAMLPASVFPLEIRTTAADDAYLSPNTTGATLVLSVSGVPGSDYQPYLRAVDRLLEQFEARPHWGKLHFMTRERLQRRYPNLDAFAAVRRSLDPHGVFLNAHLRPLFG
jgi:FAD/FMN-containing dehydrogenase